MDKHLKALEKLSLVDATMERIISGITASVRLGRYQVASDYHKRIINDNLETSQEVWEKIYGF